MSFRTTSYPFVSAGPRRRRRRRCLARYSFLALLCCLLDPTTSVSCFRLSTLPSFTATPHQIPHHQQQHHMQHPIFWNSEPLAAAHDSKHYMQKNIGNINNVVSRSSFPLLDNTTQKMMSKAMITIGTFLFLMISVLIVSPEPTKAANTVSDRPTYYNTYVLVPVVERQTTTHETAAAIRPKQRNMERIRPMEKRNERWPTGGNYYCKGLPTPGDRVEVFERELEGPLSFSFDWPWGRPSLGIGTVTSINERDCRFFVTPEDGDSTDDIMVGPKPSEWFTTDGLAILFIIFWTFGVTIQGIIQEMSRE